MLKSLKAFFGFVFFFSLFLSFSSSCLAQELNGEEIKVQMLLQDALRKQLLRVYHYVPPKKEVPWDGVPREIRAQKVGGIELSLQNKKRLITLKTMSGEVFTLEQDGKALKWKGLSANAYIFKDIHVFGKGNVVPCEGKAGFVLWDIKGKNGDEHESLSILLD